MTARCRECGHFLLQRVEVRPEPFIVFATEVIEHYGGKCPECGRELKPPRIPKDIKVDVLSKL